MGQTLSTIVGYMIVFYLNMSEKVKSVFTQEKKEKNYYNNDILLKNDDQKAKINKIIKKRRDFKETTPNQINMNEYKIIKNSTEMDETECLTDKSLNESNQKDKEIQDLHKEVINLHIEDHDRDEDVTEEGNMDNIEDLKASILNFD